MFSSCSTVRFHHGSQERFYVDLDVLRGMLYFIFILAMFISVSIFISLYFTH